MVKADKPKKEKRAAEAAADGPEKKIRKSKKEKKDLPEEETDTVLNGTAEPVADVAVEEPVSEKKKKKKRKSDAGEAAKAAPSEPPSTGKKKKKLADAEQTAAVPIAEAPVEGTVIVTAEDEDMNEAEDDEVCLYACGSAHPSPGSRVIPSDLAGSLSRTYITSSSGCTVSVCHKSCRKLLCSCRGYVVAGGNAKGGGEEDWALLDTYSRPSG